MIFLFFLTKKGRQLGTGWQWRHFLTLVMREQVVVGQVGVFYFPVLPLKVAPLVTAASCMTAHFI